MGDHTEDIVSLVANKMEKNLIFSESAMAELKVLRDIINQMHEKLIFLLKGKNMEGLLDIVKMEDEVDRLFGVYSSNHIKRLEEGRCSVESGVVFLDMVSHFERIADRIYKVSLATKDDLQGVAR